MMSGVSRLPLVLGISSGITCCWGAAAQFYPPALFAFGDSTSDTGNSQAAFPYESAPQTSPPYGQSFFRRPANRWSDGRVVVDFFAQALKIPLLSLHLQSVGYDFSHGANFAFSRVTTKNTSVSASVWPPFYFWRQTKQFQYFKERTLELWKDARRGNGDKHGMDTLGCLVSLNAAVEGINSLIRSGLLDLGVKHPEATIIYADFYRVLHTLVRNGSAHGFKETFKVCCGAGGGKYNLLWGVMCGASAFVNGELVQAKSCSDPGSYIDWDGGHITEAAARFVA